MLAFEVQSGISEEISNSDEGEMAKVYTKKVLPKEEKKNLPKIVILKPDSKIANPLSSTLPKLEKLPKF